MATEYISDLHFNEGEVVSEKLKTLLADSVLVDFQCNSDEIKFNLRRLNERIYWSSELVISHIQKLYYRRFQTGVLRRGFNNLSRLKTTNGEFEYISAVSKWSHKISRREGLQIQLFSGSILFFIGDNLRFAINDHELVEEKYAVPSTVEVSITRILTSQKKSIRETKDMINTVKSVIKAQSSVLMKEDVTSKKESFLTTKILEFAEDSIIKDPITPEQESLYKEITKRMTVMGEKLAEFEPLSGSEIFVFNGEISQDDEKLYPYDLFRCDETSLEYALKQITRYNKKVKAVVTLANVCQGEHVPVLIKDTISTRGIRTTSGSVENDHIPDTDAPVIQRLRENGFCILAKTNTSTLALDVQTYNQIFGLTNNPWNNELTAGGSSGGSAVAIARNMAPIALGSDLAGSLRIPAAFCGVVSLRPTPGRVPIEGHIPDLRSKFLSDEEQEFVIGPLAKTIGWLEKAMSVLANNWKEVADIFNFRGIISPNLWFIQTEETIKRELYDFSTFLQSFSGIFIDILEPKLNYKELIRSHNFITKETLGEEVNPEYIDYAQFQQEKGKLMLDEYFDTYDIWVLPASAVQPYPHNLEHNDFIINNKTVPYWKATISYCSWLSVLGNPVLTLPISFINAIPLGVQIVGRFGEDEKLLAIGRYLEKLMKKRIDQKWIEK